MAVSHGGNPGGREPGLGVCVECRGSEMIAGAQDKRSGDGGPGGGKKAGS